jgi:hypothetical protein
MIDDCLMRASSDADNTTAADSKAPNDFLPVNRSTPERLEAGFSPSEAADAARFGA